MVNDRLLCCTFSTRRHWVSPALGKTSIACADTARNRVIIGKIIFFIFISFQLLSAVWVYRTTSDFIRLPSMLLSLQITAPGIESVIDDQGVPE